MSATLSPRLRAAPRFGLVLATLLLFAPGCAAPARHVAPYDAQVDTTATALQAEMDGFLTNVITDPNGTYERFKGFYSDYELKLRSLLVRTRARLDNEPSTQQVELMIQDVETLRAAHASGPMTPEAAASFRDLFNQGWQAVLALELAKPHDGA